MDVWIYFMQKRKEFSNWGVEPQPTTRSQHTFRAEPGTNEQRGFVTVSLGLTEDAYVQIYEHVEVRGKGITRLAYSYNLVIEGVSTRQWHRDPYSHPEDPVHEHVGPDRVRQRGTEPVTLADVLTAAWDEISLRAEAPPRE